MNKVFIQNIIKFTIPMFGNKHSSPYFTLEVSNGDATKIVKSKEDSLGTFFTFNRKRYYFNNIGSLYNPKLEIKEFVLN